MNAIELLFHHGVYSDVEVVVGKKTHKLHKHILAQSKTFSDMFYGKNHKNFNRIDSKVVLPFDEKVGTELLKGLYGIAITPNLNFEECVLILKYCSYLAIPPPESVINRKDLILFQIMEHSIIFITRPYTQFVSYDYSSKEVPGLLFFRTANAHVSGEDLKRFGDLQHDEMVWCKFASKELEQLVSKHFGMKMFNLTVYHKTKIRDSEIVDEKWIAYKIEMSNKSAQDTNPKIIFNRFELEKGVNKFFVIDFNYELLSYMIESKEL